MKINSKYVVTVVVFFLLSFAITVQLRITNSEESAVTQEKIITQLKDEIFKLNDDNEKLNKKYVISQDSLKNVRSLAAENDATNLEKSNLITKYTIVNGDTDVKGPGIIIKYYPNEKTRAGEIIVNADITKDLVDMVNELKNAGAEAIAINDIRYTNMSSIEMEKNSIVVDTQRITRPYIIRAIGNPDTINSSLIRPGGTIELIKMERAKIELVIAKEIKISRTKKIS